MTRYSNRKDTSGFKEWMNLKGYSNRVKEDLKLFGKFFTPSIILLGILIFILEFFSDKWDLYSEDSNDKCKTYLPEWYVSAESIESFNENLLNLYLNITWNELVDKLELRLIEDQGIEKGKFMIKGLRELGEVFGRTYVILVKLPMDHLIRTDVPKSILNSDNFLMINWDKIHGKVCDTLMVNPQKGCMINNDIIDALKIDNNEFDFIRSKVIRSKVISSKELETLFDTDINEIYPTKLNIILEKELDKLSDLDWRFIEDYWFWSRVKKIIDFSLYSFVLIMEDIGMGNVDKGYDLDYRDISDKRMILKHFMYMIDGLDDMNKNGITEEVLSKDWVGISKRLNIINEVLDDTWNKISVREKEDG